MGKMHEKVLQDFAPEWDALAPGEMIQRELNATGRTQADLADRMSISKKHLNQVIKGARLTPEIALALERALGTSAKVLLKLEAEWRASRLAEESRVSLAQHVGWLRQFKTEELYRRKILSVHDDEVTQVEGLLRFFGVSDPAAYDRTWAKLQASFKRSSAYTIDEHATALWIQLAVRQAEEVAVTAPAYDAARLRQVAKRLPSLTIKDPAEAFVEFREDLRAAGVILVYIEEVPETRVSGVSLWLPSDRPLIAVTGRYKFADSLWFAIAHEIAHVLHHLKRTTFLELEGDEVEMRLHHGDVNDVHEGQANRFASELLLMGLSEDELRSASTKERLVSLAQSAGVSPGILAGQYGHLTKDYAKFGKLRSRADLSTVSPVVE